MNRKRENRVLSFIARTLKLLIKVVFYLLALLVVLILLLYIPPIQQLITNKAEQALERRLETEVHIGAINLNLFGNLILKDIYIKDPDKQKIFEVEAIDTELAVLPLLMKKIHVDHIRVSGLKSSLMIDPAQNKTNIDFIISTFSGEPDQKDPGSTKWDLFVEEVGLERSFLSLDMPGRMELSIDLGAFSLKNRSTDLNTMDFDVHSISIEDTDVILKLYNDSLSKAKEVSAIQIKSSPGNSIRSKVNRIQISNSSFLLEMGETLQLVSDIGAFDGKAIDFSLSEHLVHAEGMELKNAQTHINYSSPNQDASGNLDESNTNPNKISAKDIFINTFDWDIAANRTRLVNCEFDYQHTTPDRLGSKGYPDNIQLRAIDISLENTVLARQKLGTKINTFGFQFDEGINLEEMSGTLDYHNNLFSMQDFTVKTQHSAIIIRGDLRYDLSSKVEEQPESAQYNISDLQIDLDRRDLDFFLAQNLLKDAGIRHLGLSSSMEGNFADCQVRKFRLTLDDYNTLDLSGRIRNPVNPDKICFEGVIATMNLHSDILYEVLDSLNREVINLPEKIQLSGDVNGCRGDLLADIRLETDQGESIKLIAEYKDRSTAYKYQQGMNLDTLSLALNIHGLDLGSLLLNDKIGRLYFHSEAGISGVKKEIDHLEMIGRIDSLAFGRQLVKDIQMAAALIQDSISLHIEGQDSVLNFEFDTQGRYFDSVATLTSRLKLTELDLKGLGITEEPVTISGLLNSEEQFVKDVIDISFDLTEVFIISKNSFEFDSISAVLHKDEDSIAFDIQSSAISGWFNSTIAPDQLVDHLLEFYKPHFLVEDTLPRPKYSGSLRFNFTSDQSLDNLLPMVPGLEELWFSRIEGELNELQNTSYVTLSIPKIKYRDVSFDSLYFNISSNPTYLGYTFKVPGIGYGKYTVNNFNLSGQTDHGTVNNILFLQDTTGENLIRVGFYFQSADKNEMVFRINPDSLIINAKQWSINDDNTISIEPGRRIYGDIQIDDGQQSLKLLASDTLYQVNINDFQLGNLSSILKNFDPEMHISGDLNIASDIRFRDETILVNSNILVDDFVFQETQFGNITMEAGNDRDNNISGTLVLENGRNSLHLNGSYATNRVSDPFNAELIIDLNETEDFKSFGKDFIRNPQGNIQGNLILKGNKDHLDANGKIDFNDFNFLLVPVNNTYSIDRESISVNKNILVFNDFMLLDSAQNAFSINGNIQTEKFQTFAMDLSLKADRFSVYNVTAASNPHFYGALIVSMDADIKGTTDNPNIWLDLTIDQGTNLIYALPPKNFDLVDSEGIVEFVDFSEADSIQELRLEQYVGDTIFSKLNWIDLNAIVNIDRSAQFMIDIDPISGDYIQFGGSGNLNLLVQKKQNPRITGTYEFDRGIYEVSFYGLVRKTFDFTPGSIISWSGDPYAASMNLKATNTIRTASAGLVAREIYGLPEEEKSKYRRALPYTVEINIAGQVEKPEITFGIDLPDEDRNGFPLVDTKLNQLAEPDHESELTRQVFGLLTIGSFIPETTGPGGGADYGSAFASTAAINSLNSILTNELNKLSGKYITFADLDIGMQSFSEMGGGVQSNRTTMDVKLSKKLFDDRVTIEAQSSFDVFNDTNKYNHATEQSTVHSDFAIIYDLTEKGDYKLKAFERSAYDIIYKDTRMGGAAVIFIKEFDTYKKERKSDQ